MVWRSKTKWQFKQSGQSTLCTNHADFITQHQWSDTPVEEQETCWRSSTKIRIYASLLPQMSSSKKLQISTCQSFDVSPWHSKSSWTEHAKIEIVLTYIHHAIIICCYKLSFEIHLEIKVFVKVALSELKINRQLEACMDSGHHCAQCLTFYLSSRGMIINSLHLESQWSCK